jgi:nucleotidyltransferase substrate binding protein (TIGR01987 family)
MTQDIRWQQRFQNFTHALTLLRSAMESKPLAQMSDLEQEGLIQRFEYTYELAWKVIKDYLEYRGVMMQEVTPRNVIKEAFAAKIVADGQMWIDIMLLRNRLSHTYDSKVFKEALNLLQEKYLGAFVGLHSLLNDHIVKS